MAEVKYKFVDGKEVENEIELEHKDRPTDEKKVKKKTTMDKIF